MIIEKIEIGSFGKLDNMTLELSGGVNIIRGANESGKSTICNFIVFIFYGLPKDRDLRAKYISWNTGAARGAITFKNDDGTRYRIERDAIHQTMPDGKSVVRERVAVYNADTGAPVSKNEMPGGIFFGVPENVFNSTVYIRQLDGTKIGNADLSEAAENILFSGDEGLNTKKAVEKLDEARVHLRYKNKKGGKLFELEEKREELSQKLEEAKDAGNEIICLEGSVRQLDEAHADSSNRAERLKDELELYEAYTIKKSYTKYKETLREIKDLEAKAQSIRLSESFNGVDVYSDEYIQSLEKKNSSLEIARARLSEAQNRFDAARKHVYDMKEKIEVFEKFGTKHGQRASTIAEAEALYEKVRGYTAIKKGCLLAGIAFFIFAAALGLFTVLKLISGVEIYMFTILGISVLLFLGFGVVYNKISAPLKRLKEICGMFGCSTHEEFDELVKAVANDEAVMTIIADERDAAEGAYKSASDNLDSVSNDLLAFLERAGFEISDNTSASIENALAICREKKNEYDDIMRRQGECKSRLSEIEQSINSYDDEFVKQACVKEYDNDAMEKYDYHARKREYEFLCGSVKSQNEKLRQIETRLAALTATNVRPSELAQAKDAIEREYADLDEKYEAYRLAIDSMAAASGKLREGLAPKIAKNASAIISTLSNGKYTALGVDSEFGMTFTSDTVSHDVDLLSAGTSDIAYISLRIALIDVLFRKSIPPFIFDESFMRMDNERMKNSLTLLCEFGKGGTQSLLFTCHGREEKLMKIIGEYTYYTI